MDSHRSNPENGKKHERGRVFGRSKKIQKKNDERVVKRGPITAMLATLGHLGWTMLSPTILRTDQGEDLKLAEMDPKQVRSKLEQTILRQQEQLTEEAVVNRTACTAQEAANIKEFGIDFEATRKALNSKKTKSRAKRIIGQLAANSYPIGRHLRKIGIKAPADCPCCEKSEDTLDHRIWDCPALADIRSKHVAADIQKWAKEGEGKPVLQTCV